MLFLFHLSVLEWSSANLLLSAGTKRRARNDGDMSVRVVP